MAGLRKVMEKISSVEKETADKATQTRRSPSCHNCFNRSPLKRDSFDEPNPDQGNVTTMGHSRGHIYEDHRDRRATEDVDHDMAKQTMIKEV